MPAEDPDLHLRRGGPADAAAVVALFDEAVAWLVARGQTGQWGTQPASGRPALVERIRAWAAGDGMWLAESGGEPVGVIVVGSRPAHVAPIAAPELYVELLLTSRRRAGARIGSALVAHALGLAAQRGVPILRVDCWAGAPSLVAWYERQGFVRSDTFDVDGWIGQVFEQRVDAVA